LLFLTGCSFFPEEMTPGAGPPQGSQASGGAAESPAPLLLVATDRVDLVANGTDTASITARLLASSGEPILVEGAAVVRFVATSGILDRSAAVLEEGSASVRLTADRAEALGRESERPITVRAVLEVDEATQVTGVVDLVEVAPADQPALFLSAEAAALPAD